jgi:hypothetical protein
VLTNTLLYLLRSESLSESQSQVTKRVRSCTGMKFSIELVVRVEASDFIEIITRQDCLFYCLRAAFREHFAVIWIRMISTVNMDWATGEMGFNFRQRFIFTKASSSSGTCRYSSLKGTMNSASGLNVAGLSSLLLTEVKNQWNRISISHPSSCCCALSATWNSAVCFIFGVFNHTASISD